MPANKGAVITESVLLYHADLIGIDSDELVQQACGDGIIVESELVQLGGSMTRRYRMAGSIRDLQVYAQRLVALDGGDR